MLNEEKDYMKIKIIDNGSELTKIYKDCIFDIKDNEYKFDNDGGLEIKVPGFWAILNDNEYEILMQ